MRFGAEFISYTVRIYSTLEKSDSQEDLAVEGGVSALTQSSGVVSRHGVKTWGQDMGSE